MIPVEEAPPTIVTCGVLAVQLIVLLALIGWGFWVARRQGNRPFWKAAAAAPIVSVVLWHIGIFVTIFALIRAFGTLGYAPAAERAQLLSEGISHAMTAGAVFMLPAALLFVASLVAFIVGTFMQPSAAKSG